MQWISSFAPCPEDQVLWNSTRTSDSHLQKWPPKDTPIWQQDKARTARSWTSSSVSQSRPEPRPQGSSQQVTWNVSPFSDKYNSSFLTFHSSFHKARKRHPLRVIELHTWLYRDFIVPGNFPWHLQFCNEAKKMRLHITYTNVHKQIQGFFIYTIYMYGNIF